MKPTKEQIEIINSVKEGFNLRISAIAGSGKTTTSLLLASEFSDKKILLLTYNNFLASNTNEKIKEWDLKNIDCYTFHGFIMRAYGKKCANDDDLVKIKEENEYEFNNKLKSYDLIVLDEIQDMKLIIYEPIINILYKQFSKSQLIILGDQFQTLYEYAKSSKIFLNFANEIWNINQYKWKDCLLSESFRISKQTANYLNEVFYKKQIIKPEIFSNKDIPNSIVNFVCDTFDSHSIFQFLEYEFEKYSDKDIYILNAKVHNLNENHPVKLFVNYLSNKKERKIIYKNNMNNKSKKELINKICVTSFHQSKGTERKFVIIFGYDSGIDYSKKKVTKFPHNTLYVGITRASEKIVLISSEDNSKLFYLENNSNIENNYIEYQNLKNKSKYNEFQKPEKNNDEIEYEVTSLLIHLNILNRDYANYFDLFKEDFKIEKHKFTTKSIINFDNTNYYENVSEINGFAFPLFFIKDINNKNIYDHLKALLNELSFRATKMRNGYFTFPFLKDNFDKLKNLITLFFEKKDFSKEDIVEIALLDKLIFENENSKYNQIKSYDWIEENDKLFSINAFKHVLDYFDKKNLLFEFPISSVFLNFPGSDKTVKLNGRVDMIDETTKTIWENKFVDEVNLEHFLQAIIYKIMLEKKEEKYKEYSLKLFNLKSQEIFNITLKGDYQIILEKIIQNKLFASNKNDEKILSEVRETLKKIKSK